MRAQTLGGVALLAAVMCAAPSAVRAQGPEPSLVVLIVVDQLRADLVERYRPALDGGLRRFLEEGYSFSGASHAHAITLTAAGHATISTGVFPSRSGIVGNNWQQRVDGQLLNMYSVEDGDAEIVGYERGTGRSPRNLLRTGLADWILEADSDARVVSVSGKDRAAITLAGKARGHVYWLYQGLGRFVTSDYYRNDYPSWVARFNSETMTELMAETVWDSSVPAEQRRLARADTASYEGDAVNTAFPHLASLETNPSELRRLYSWAHEQPRSDVAVLALARLAVDELDLGRRGSVDYLAISLSAADYIGHSYGPLSQEQLDNVVRLDRGLGAFLEYLDDRVGGGQWVAAFTADHGVATMPEYLQSMGDREARRVDDQERLNELTDALVEAASRGGAQPDLAERLARTLERRGLVAKAYTHYELTRGEPADSFATLFRNSHYPGRAHSPLSPYGVEIRYGFNELVHFSTGTTHGSPYWYDRHVPFILLGAGVTQGSSDGPVYSVDVAPTLAALAGIPAPDDLDGKPVNR